MAFNLFSRKKRKEEEALKEQQRLEAEQLQKEQEAQKERERLEAEQLQKEQEAQKERERLEAEQRQQEEAQKAQERLEAERLQKEQEAQKERERLEAEQRQREEARKEQERLEAERLQKEQEAQQERERLEAEQRQREEAQKEQERLEAESDKKKERLEEGLSKTKNSFFKKFTRSIAGKTKVDIDVLDELEENLVASDVGIDTTVKIIDRLEARVAKDKYMNTSELNKIMLEEIEALLDENQATNFNADFKTANGAPYVILVVGVNGVGKTTTIGKLANKFKKAGKKVILGAADTFRAAAIEQIEIWSERVDIPLVKQRMGADPAAVAYDTVNKAVAGNYDVAIIDTAGRLHNKINLMNELSKIHRSVKKVIPDGPHEVLLVLDASTGQNAFEQAKQFTLATEVSALALTKLDGTAKGGVVIGISAEFKIPVKYIGVGEQIDDLQIFDKHLFVESLFSKKD